MALPGREVPVTPKILGAPSQIERAVVRLKAGLSAAPPRIEPVPPGAAQAKATTLTEDAFYDQLAKVDATLPDCLKALVASLERALNLLLE